MERMMRERSSTVEPVLGTLINFTGMGRIYTRGITSANKFMIGAGIAYNLKKYMRFIYRKRISACNALQKQVQLTKGGVFSIFLSLRRMLKAVTGKKKICTSLKHPKKLRQKRF